MAEAAEPSASPPPSVSSSPPPPLVDLKRVHFVCQWSWDLSVDICAICRNLVMEPCIECQANATQGKSSQVDSSDCSVAWGVCSHGFHSHCINRWLRTRGVCPLDNQDWEFLRYSSNQT